MPKRRCSHSGTERHVDGPLCTNKLQKHGMFCGLPKPNCQLRLHIPGMVLFVYGQELYYIASYQMQEELRI